MKVGFVLRFAWRDGRFEIRRHLLHLTALIVGVAAIVSLASLRGDLERGIHAEGRVLLGGDLRITSSAPFGAPVLAVLDSMELQGARVARSVQFGSMVSVPETDSSRFLQVLSISGGYPVYGELRDEPSGSWSHLGPGRVLADPQVRAQLGVQVGDTLRIGDREVVLTGVVEGLPPETGFRSALGPGLYVWHEDVEGAGLLGVGSVAQWRAHLGLPDGVDGSEAAGQLRSRLAEERVSIRSAEREAENLVEAVGFFAGFVGLVAFSALLLGGIGIAGSSLAHLGDKARTTGVLRSLGAGRRTVAATLLLQSAGLALAAGIAGVLVGVAGQVLGVQALGGALGMDLSWEFQWQAVAAGLLLGLWFAFLASALPLVRILSDPPSVGLRRQEDGTGRSPLRWGGRGALAVLVGASLLVASFWAAESAGHGLLYAGGLLVVCGCLLGTARLLIRGVRGLLSPEAPFSLRYGLGALYRPANQTDAAVLAVGVGVFVLTTMAVVERSFLGQLDRLEAVGGANVLLFDIGPDERESVARILREVGVGGGERVDFTPIIPARMEAFRGRSVAELAADPEVGVPGWTLRRTYRHTYRDSLTASERLVSGDWWDPGTSDSADSLGEGGLPRISLERELAMDLGVRLGDTIVWDVQGVSVPSRVSNVREVDWARFEPNFFVVFEPGSLDGAPRSFLVATHLSDPLDRERLQARIAAEVPGAAVLDFTRLRDAVESVVRRVRWGVRGLTGVVILASFLVLSGVVLALRRRKIREAVLLRTLGGGRGSVLRALGVEYALLGAVAALSGVVLGVGAGVLLMTLQFQISPSVPLGWIAAVAASVPLLTTALGVAGTAPLLRRSPSSALSRVPE